MKRSFIYVVLGLLFLSCSRFSDYNEKQEGVYMKMCSFDEGNLDFRPSFYKNASVLVKSNDEIFLRIYKEQLISAKDKRLNFLFQHLTKGDSAMFKVKRELFENQMNIRLNNSAPDYLDAEVKVYDYLASAPSGHDPEMEEQILLKKYLKEHQIESQKGGVFVQQLIKGAGEKIERDKVVTIHYVGRFLNELEFDNTHKSNAFTFTYGTPGQVIKGLDIALKGMKAGEKAKIIIPSQLAFEEEGSSTGVVPPFSTVVYELEIINVK